jgi:FixJ family two-component response regulator
LWRRFGGGTNEDIAVQLAASEDTVKHHMSNIADKVTHRWSWPHSRSITRSSKTGADHPD